MELRREPTVNYYSINCKTLPSLLLLEAALLSACAASLPEDDPAVSQERRLGLPAGTELLAAAGDIADCRDQKGAAVRATADLLRTRFPG